MMLKTEYKRVGREFPIESLSIKNIVSQGSPRETLRSRSNEVAVSQGSPGEMLLRGSACLPPACRQTGQAGRCHYFTGRVSKCRYIQILYLLNHLNFVKLIFFSLNDFVMLYPILEFCKKPDSDYLHLFFNLKT